LVGGQRVALGVHGQGVVTGVEGGAAGQQGDGLGRAAVVGERAQLEVGGVGDDDVAACAVDQAAAAARADQVVAAVGGGVADPVVGGAVPGQKRCGCRVAAEDTVGQCRNAAITAVDAAAGVGEVDGRVPGQGAVGQRQRPPVADAPAREAGGVPGKGAVGHRQLGLVVDASA